VQSFSNRKKNDRLSPTMSILPPEVHNELTQLLQALQSSDNSIRTQAEEHLQNNWTLTRPEVLLMGLAEQVQNNPDATVCVSLVYGCDEGKTVLTLGHLATLLCLRNIPAHCFQAAQK
jgi:hypothetical protein